MTEMITTLISRAQYWKSRKMMNPTVIFDGVVRMNSEKNWFDEELVEFWVQEVKDTEGCGEAHLRALEFLEIVKAKM